LRLVAVDLAGGTWGFLTMNLTLWSLANWVALSGTGWVITLPSALWVAGRVVTTIGFKLELSL